MTTSPGTTSTEGIIFSIPSRITRASAESMFLR
eukprot:CAMPEP_0194314680 /NCGR_PEP_ID=MMETSP0171-20130528/11536_1 /TAXON_ID=218684 /ORGANISM="Corethron pennatum, Strain L29A3" /LENGTH=32 /DNA_ID= /DNA_START= /DNA_END= /DNA_ORIENTATION=